MRWILGKVLVVIPIASIGPFFSFDLGRDVLTRRNGADLW
jgi:hypothetical protein